MAQSHDYACIHQTVGHKLQASDLCIVALQTTVAVASDAAEVVKRLALPLSLGQQMAQQWRQGEAAYLQGMSLVFAQLRTERAVYPGHYAAVRNVYLVYLQRPGQDKQDKVCHTKTA